MKGVYSSPYVSNSFSLYVLKQKLSSKEKPLFSHRGVKAGKVIR